MVKPESKKYRLYKNRCFVQPVFDPAGIIKDGESLVGVNADLLFVLGLVLEFDVTVDQRKKCVIGAHADIVAGMNSGSSLSDDDVSGKDRFAVGLLHAKALGFTVATVLRRADTFFMSKKL